MRSRCLLLPVCAILFFASCQPENNDSRGEPPYTPPSISAEQESCCRGILALFEEYPEKTLPDSVIACAKETLMSLPPGFPETGVRCRYALAYQESTLRNFKQSNDQMLAAVKRFTGRNNLVVDSLLADMYSLIAVNYQLQYEYTRTLAFSKQAEALYHKLEDWESLVNELSNQAVCYLSVGASNEAAEKMNQAERLFREKVPNPRKPVTSVNLENNKVLLSIQEGDQYALSNWPEKSRIKYAGALQKIDSLLMELTVLVKKDSDNWEVPYVYTQFSKAALLSKMANGQSSQPFLEQSQFVLRFFGGPQWDSPGINGYSGYVLVMVAKALALQGKLEEASRYLRLGLLRQGYSNDNLLNSPALQPGLVPRADFMVSSLQEKGNILRLYYDKTGDQQYIEAALKNFEQGMAYLDSVRILQADDAAAEAARRAANEFINDAAQMVYQLYKANPKEERLGQLFQLVERGKSYTVRQALFRQLSFLEFEGEMQKLLQREQQLRGRLQHFRDTGQQDSLIFVTRQYESFINELRTSASPIWRAYYKERFSDETISLKQARQLLDDTTAILSFVHGPGSGLCFVLTKDQATVVPLPMEDGRIAEAAQALKDNLQTGSTGPYPENAYRLYQLAFSEPLQHLSANIRSLVIVPDGALQGLPFECLLTRNTPGRPLADYPYLMDEYSISYVYSVGVYDYLKKLPEKQKDYEIGAFLSDYKEGEAEGQPLRCADQPLDEMARRTKSIIRNFKQRGHSTICKEEAGEASFKSLAGQCRILHFSAHGCAEASQARDYAILFTLDGENGEDGNLRSGEILSLGLAGTALAVLSSCDTHFGINQPGEGLASIARAFSIAGCSSLLASTYKARQGPTAEITALFYDQLLAGRPKDVALNIAKKQYRQQNPKAEPADWAPLILIGDGKALY